MKILLFILLLIVICVVIGYVSLGDYSFDSIMSNVGKSKYYDAEKEAEKERILKEHENKTEFMTDDDRKKVYYEDYAEAENLPEIAYWITLVLVVSGFWAIYGQSQFHIKISMACCVILVFFSYKLILLALFCDVVLIPTLMCMALDGLFGNKK
jgi:hypothetical protein